MDSRKVYIYHVVQNLYISHVTEISFPTNWKIISVLHTKTPTVKNSYFLRNHLIARPSSDAHTSTNQIADLCFRYRNQLEESQSGIDLHKANQ